MHDKHQFENEFSMLSIKILIISLLCEEGYRLENPLPINSPTSALNKIPIHSVSLA